jgi:prepilin-type N-terminal cleavage/methylation domain-containing protein/prepilin-type processing-associated H-X9-DG protein
MTVVGPARRGFTLVELMVVIGIISLLIAVLLPALTAARRQANAVACAAHLREIARGFALYAADNRDMYPWAQFNYTPSGGGQQRVITWDDLIRRYVGQKLTQAEIDLAYAPRPAELFVCPADAIQREPYAVTLASGQQVSVRSYGVSSSPAMFDSHATFEGVGGQMATGEPIPWNLIYKSLCIKQAQIRQAYQTILAFDMPSRTNNLGGFFAYAGRPYDQIVGFTGVAGLDTKGVHGKRFNYVFCDGHVELLLARDTVHAVAGDTWYYNTNYMWTRNARD